jgi:CheY-like chemotaxis protein
MADGITLHRVTGGQDALQFLTQAGPYSDAPRIRCLLLDLMMANGDGQWLLERLAERDRLKVPPTIILSGDPDGVADSRKFHFVSCSIVKPGSNEAFEALLDTVRRITMMQVGMVA